MKFFASSALKDNLKANPSYPPKKKLEDPSNREAVDSSIIIDRVIE